jgi:hypothetical protein
MINNIGLIVLAVALVLIVLGAVFWSSRRTE